MQYFSNAPSKRKIQSRNRSKSLSLVNIYRLRLLEELLDLLADDVDSFLRIVSL